MWKYKIVNLSMPADWLEIHVEYTTPTGGTFTKMYSLSQAQTPETIDSFILNEITKLEGLSTNYALLSSMMGTEFSTDNGQIVDINDGNNMPTLGDRLTAIEDVLMMLLV